MSQLATTVKCYWCIRACENQPTSSDVWMQTTNIWSKLFILVIKNLVTLWCQGSYKDAGKMWRKQGETRLWKSRLSALTCEIVTPKKSEFLYMQKLSFFLLSYSTTTKKPCLKLHFLLPYLPLPNIGWHLTVKDHCFFCICITRTTDSPPSSASPLWQLCRL